MRATILVVDDDQELQRLLATQLETRGYDVETAADLATLKRRMGDAAPAAVLLDLQLPDGSGLDALGALVAAWPDTPVGMSTGHGSVQSAVQVMHDGAFTYLEKPFRGGEVEAVLKRALETATLRRQAEDRRQRDATRFGLDHVVGPSDAMRSLVDRARTVARSPAATVLLLGESGTGKGMFARAIHHASDRAGAPFLTVTCSAIPEHLLEAELFGHEKGAFTDAKQRRTGVFEAAQGGTILLDEIGDMPLSLQAKLLGVLEERTFRRLGGTKDVQVDVRIVAATHRDLDALCAAREFRRDLYYRLRVVPLTIPPLRDRAEDVVPLARRFVKHFNAEFGRHVEAIAPDAEQALLAHAWPGNVRELRNVVEHAMLFVGGTTLRAGDLSLDRGARPAASARPAPRPDAYVLPPEGVRLDDLERSYVEQALRRAGGVKSHAARLLGISRDQMRYRIRKLKEPCPRTP